MDTVTNSVEKILVVDDDKDYLEVLSDLLKEHGYGVICCSSSLNALEIVSKMLFQCVLLDYRMPFLDGQDVLRLVHARFPNIPVIMCSGFIGDQEPAFVQAGAFQVLHKPFEQQALLHTIRKAIGRDNQPSPN